MSGIEDGLLAMKKAAAYAIAYRRQVASVPTTPAVGYGAMLAAFDTPLPEQGGDAVAIIDELVARVRALLRRPPAYLGNQLRLGAMAFDTLEKQLVIAGSRHTPSAREAAILEVLLRRSNHVVPKAILEDQLYGLSADGSANAVEVYVHRLRKQLESLGCGVEIHTIRGVGYLIREET